MRDALVAELRDRCLRRDRASCWLACRAAASRPSVALVAERLDRPFVDTDAVFERLHGRPRPTICSSHGEAAFREAEDGGRRRGLRSARSGDRSRRRRDHRPTEPMGALAPRGRRLARRAARDPGPPPPERCGRSSHLPAVRRRAALGGDGRACAVLPRGRRPARRYARSPKRVADELTRLASAPTGRRLFDAEVRRHHPIGPDARAGGDGCRPRTSARSRRAARGHGSASASGNCQLVPGSRSPRR